jgi:HD-GYP domain-containing protein (c-di-GMP phosphodiesterase class II)
VDYFDASTMDRPYRSARPTHEVLASMRVDSGIRFDPEVLDAFLSSLPELQRLQEDLPAHAMPRP